MEILEFPTVINRSWLQEKEELRYKLSQMGFNDSLVGTVLKEFEPIYKSNTIKCKFDVLNVSGEGLNESQIKIIEKRYSEGVHDFLMQFVGVNKYLLSVVLDLLIRTTLAEKKYDVHDARRFP